MAALSTLRFPQLAKEPLLTSTMGPNGGNRLRAKIIDLVLVYGVMWVVGQVLGKTAAFLVPPLLFATMERAGVGQSPGKWILGLHTIELRRGRRARPYQALVRNLPFILFFWCLGLPGLYQFFLLPPVLIWLGFECYFLFSIKTGVRIGDVLGNTRVFDFKDQHTLFIEKFLKEDAP